MSIQWVTRAAWQAARSSGSENVYGAVRYGICVHWTGAPSLSYSHKACLSQTRGIQRYHQQNKGWADIAYNYLICPHGYVLVGRGEQAASAANGTTAANMTFPAVCFLSGVGEDTTQEAKNAFNDLRLYLMQRKVGPKVNPHLSFVTTQCPGPRIRKWLLQYP